MPITGMMLEVWIIVIISIFGLGILVMLISKCCSKKQATKSIVGMNEALIEKYEHVGDEPIGKGACGAAWKVKIKGDDSGTFYVSKEAHVANETGIAFFKKERECMRLCDHPNICKLIDSYGEGEKGSALVLEMVKGKNMLELIKEKYADGLPRDVAMNWMTQMASAVCYLNTEVGICHRDLHPGNWMVSEDGEKVTLIDFGISVVVGVGKLLPKTICFSSFASLEVFGRVPSSYDAEVWYLGMVFHQLCHP
jgi:serine/threonine protein kinase